MRPHEGRTEDAEDAMKPDQTFRDGTSQYRISGNVSLSLDLLSTGQELSLIVGCPPTYNAT